MALTAEEIFSIQDRKLESTLVPQWNDAQVFIRTMGALERAKYEAMLVEGKNDPLDMKMYRMKVTLVILCCCDGSRSS